MKVLVSLGRVPEHENRSRPGPSEARPCALLSECPQGKGDLNPWKQIDSMDRASGGVCKDVGQAELESWMCTTASKLPDLSRDLSSLLDPGFPCRAGIVKFFL